MPAMKVAFDEADSEGIVFFGNYFRLAHRALEQHLPTLGIPWEAWFKAVEFGVPLRHAEAEYLKPLRPGEEFSIAVKVADIGESSVKFEYEVNGPLGVCARLKTSHVFVARDAGPMRKVRIPDELRRKLQTGS